MTRKTKPPRKPTKPVTDDTMLIPYGALPKWRPKGISPKPKKPKSFDNVDDMLSYLNEKPKKPKKRKSK